MKKSKKKKKRTESYWKISSTNNLNKIKVKRINKAMCKPTKNIKIYKKNMSPK